MSHGTGTKSRRKVCPRTCECLCHDLGGGPMHPGQPCPGKGLQQEEQE